MTPLETIAREIASVFSHSGEDDWRRYLSIAQQIEDRLAIDLRQLGDANEERSR